MTRLFLICAMLVAVPALASPWFPTVPGAIWTLEDDDPASTMSLTMAGEVIFHEASCYPRYERVDGVMVGITYWSVDGSGRVLLIEFKV